MSTAAVLHHVLVDFENVPTVDLTPIGDKVAKITLLIGEKQRRLELGLVQQIHAHAAKVTLIEVGASGRNALDLVLAWHLGKIAERHPDDSFWVVSRDKDFDPLIAHLRVRGLQVSRVEAFSALPFLAAASPIRKTPAPRRQLPAAKLPPAAGKTERFSAVPPALTTTTDDDRLAKLIDRLEHKTTARPVRRKTLLSHINGFYANQLSAAELDAIAEELQQRGIIIIDPDGRVSYPKR